MWLQRLTAVSSYYLVGDTRCMQVLVEPDFKSTLLLQRAFQYLFNSQWNITTHFYFTAIRSLRPNKHPFTYIGYGRNALQPFYYKTKDRYLIFPILKTQLDIMDLVQPLFALLTRFSSFTLNSKTSLLDHQRIYFTKRLKSVSNHDW